MAIIQSPTNSVWPNGLQTDSEGYVIFYPLGTNKIDISTVTWPTGDKIISPFVYDENDKLVGFVDTKALTVSGSATTTMNYSHIEADFSSISEGSLTVNTPNATVKKFKWAVSTDGGESFDFVIIDFNTTDQETIDTVRTAKRVVDNKLYDADDNLIGTLDTSKIEVAGIFDTENNIRDGLYCNMDTSTVEQRNLILNEFNSNLSSLVNSAYMFTFSKIASFKSNLSSLTNGYAMFTACEDLTIFDPTDLRSLIIGDGMLAGTAITSFNFNLSSLISAYQMFYNCQNLTSFTSDLSSLTNGTYMFHSCKLDSTSIKNIIDTINTVSSGSIILGLGCDTDTTDKNLFAQEAGYADMTSLLAALQAKGWTVYTQHNGRPSSTYSLRKPAENTLPVFAKLEEDKKYVDYTSEDGSKKYMLNWFHETTGSTEGYTQYATLEEAVEALNIKPIERN